MKVLKQYVGKIKLKQRKSLRHRKIKQQSRLNLNVDNNLNKIDNNAENEKYLQ